MENALVVLLDHLALGQEGRQDLDERKPVLASCEVPSEITGVASLRSAQQASGG